MSKRIFIALKAEPGPGLLKLLHEAGSTPGAGRIKWVDPGNLHITLAFLGDTEEERITVASMVLQRICSSTGPFSFSLKGLGVFRNFRDLKVIWVGTDHEEELVLLGKRLSEGLKDAGFRLEKKEFVPHITLGRIKVPGDNEHIKSYVVHNSETFFQEIKVEEIILFESILKPAGPVYKALGKFRLKS